MDELMLELELRWEALRCLRDTARMRGNRWTEEQTKEHDNHVAEIDTLVAKLPEVWAAWKGSM